MAEQKFNQNGEKVKFLANRHALYSTDNGSVISIQLRLTDDQRVFVVVVSVAVKTAIKTCPENALNHRGWYGIDMKLSTDCDQMLTKKFREPTVLTL